MPGVSSADDRRDIVILRALPEALDPARGRAFAPAFGNSTDQMDYRWGKLHRIMFAHPLGGAVQHSARGRRVPAAARPVLGGIPTDGGFGAVDASNHDPRAETWNGFMFTNGPVNRFVAEAGRRRHGPNRCGPEARAACSAARPTSTCSRGG